MNMEQTGYLHVYTGNGKGKTTSAFGLAVRALCAGRSVYIGQFVKSMKYNETKIEQLFDRVRIEQLGSGCFITREPAPEDIRLAQEGWARCAALLESGEYDLVILDELTIEPGDSRIGRRVRDIRDLGDSLIVLIRRKDGNTVVPRGDTRIQEGDVLVMNTLEQ